MLRISREEQELLLFFDPCHVIYHCAPSSVHSRSIDSSYTPIERAFPGQLTHNIYSATLSWRKQMHNLIDFSDKMLTNIVSES